MPFKPSGNPNNLSVYSIFRVRDCAVWACPLTFLDMWKTVSGSLFRIQSGFKMALRWKMQTALFWGKFGVSVAHVCKCYTGQWPLARMLRVFRVNYRNRAIYSVKIAHPLIALQRQLEFSQGARIFANKVVFRQYSVDHVHPLISHFTGG